MKSVTITGFVVDNTVYVNKVKYGMYLPSTYNPDEGFTKIGWWLPTDSANDMTEILVSGNDSIRHCDISLNGTVLRPDGRFYDVKLCGENHRLMFQRNSLSVMVFSNDSESAHVSTYIEYLAANPKLDNVGDWSADRIVATLSNFPGNHQFVKYKTLTELIDEVKNIPMLELAPFSRERIKEQNKFEHVKI